MSVYNSIAQLRKNLLREGFIIALPPTKIKICLFSATTIFYVLVQLIIFIFSIIYLAPSLSKGVHSQYPESIHSKH